MSNLGSLTFMLIALSCYAVSDSMKLIRNDHQAAKNVELPNRIIEQRQNVQNEQRQQLNLIQHGIKDEARQKRSQLPQNSHRQHQQRDANEGFKDMNDIIEDLEDNSIVPAPEFDMESMPPLTYYLLLQKLRQLQNNEPIYRVRTPRLGRSIDFRLLDAMGDIGGANSEYTEDNGVGDDNGVSRQFVTRVIKKSVPFKPRLGKRAQMCD